MNYARIIFWEPCVSPHKSRFFEALASKSPSIEVVCCAHQPLQKERQILGWSGLEGRGCRQIIAPSHAQIEELIESDISSSLNIFSGTRHLSTNVTALGAVKKNNARFGLMTEPRVNEGMAGLMRYFQSWATEQWIRKRCEFVLAIGRNGPAWYQSVGYSPNKIFPFAYFVDPPKVKEEEDFQVVNQENNKEIQIGYIGRLVAEKGVFDLANAVRRIGTRANVTFVGAGRDEEKLKKRCVALSLSAKFPGVVPIEKIGSVLRRFDVLVLASTTMDDGWGVVVSEALMSGVAVVASDRVGASIMLDESLFGSRVPRSSPEAIANAISQLDKEGAFSSSCRRRRRVLARKRLSADAGAEYLTTILNYTTGSSSEKPVPFYQFH